MSKASTQQLTLLAIVFGTLAEMQEAGYISIVSVKKLLGEAETDTRLVMKQWPTTGDDKKNSIKIANVAQEWAMYMQGENGVELTITNMAFMCEKAVFDLSDRVTDGYKTELLDKLLPKISAIVDFVDPNEAHSRARQEALIILEHMYKLIGWDFNWEESNNKMRAKLKRRAQRDHSN